MRVRLTDQALVAVRLAHQVAALAGRGATVADALVGLLTEPEGRAGRRLRERASAAAALAERAPQAPGPPLEEALRHAAAGAERFAVTTVDLLDAVLAVGGEAVADLLVAAGYDRDLDGYAWEAPLQAWPDDAETYGLRPGEERLTPPAARAVAQVRARDGGATELLLALASAPDPEAAELLGDPDALALQQRRLRDAPPGGSGERDRGLEPVLRAATTIAAGTSVTSVDLVRAAVVAGGWEPRALFEAGRP